MKRGDKVFVCHDGKYGRRVVGVVTKTRNGHHIEVEFPNPADDAGGMVRFTARKIPSVRYRRERNTSPMTVTATLKHRVYFGGWADIDWFCPWFSVWPFNERDAK